MQTFSIEPATASDCNECARLLAEHLGELGVNASAEALAQVVEGVICDPVRGFILAARENGRVVGIAYVATILSLEHCGTVAWLEELFVESTYRQRGIGTALISAILERAKTTGIVAVDLEVDAAQHQAVSFYERLGFRRLDRSRFVKDLSG